MAQLQTTSPQGAAASGACSLLHRAYRDRRLYPAGHPTARESMEAFAAAGVTGLVELAPAGALVGLAKRGLKGLPTVAVKTPDDLAAAHELIDAG